MRTKLVHRYYCDHCKKSGCSGHHMRQHEHHCCGNPDRVCRMCVFAELEQRPIAALIVALEEGLSLRSGGHPGDDGYFSSDLVKLREVSDGCPACMLAAMIQLKKREKIDKHDEEYYFAFDFRAESKTFLAEHSETHEW